MHIPRLYWAGFFYVLYRAFIFGRVSFPYLACCMPCAACCGRICKALYYGFVFLCYDLVLLCSCVMPLSFGYILLTVAASTVNRD